jgi:hypothetical protein
MFSCMAFGSRLLRELVRVTRHTSLVTCFILSLSGIVHAAGFKPPDECQAYTGDAHLNCLYAYIELQKDRLGKIEEQLKDQQSGLRELRDKVERKAESSTIEKAAPLPPEREYVPVPTPPMYGGFGYGYPPYYYGYPPVGLGFYFGPRYFYGPRFFGPRYFGPRYFGPRYRRW